MTTQKYTIKKPGLTLSRKPIAAGETVEIPADLVPWAVEQGFIDAPDTDPTSNTSRKANSLPAAAIAQEAK
ncbi:TPA: hypothetical protein UNJ94_000117 [Stenotrophomonas maltophilia]|uniref:hypothetical protein n=1 Tax=Stenotrophomonas maltophilia TaxID=40324 RepID=UPI000B51A175|nr:hypothetical protein [Stenotrophomonas maltophilia]ASE54596.1 hypothetical protein CEQ03_18845 [Stenotrophomonas maltophilia]ELE7121492.1 hypothetical protein [Stenotrophomonas maltophilia]MBH1555162.1 hypothetical protein [Stenotrophomonas maltophilia]MBH1676237.1 hypothetical protein [Stenotrophomonas maltophilia]MBH1780315.1 hypothetical protein [Stenotrophomonas maltophilia]